MCRAGLAEDLFKGDSITNNFGYDEFLRPCEELEMAPLLVVNFRDGVLAEYSPEMAARHAAKVVTYCNAEIGTKLPADLAVWPRLRAANGHPAPYRVMYFILCRPFLPTITNFQNSTG